MLHPMDAKMQLAHTVIAGFQGEEPAKRASDEFRRVFRERQAPDEAPRHAIPQGTPKRLSAILVELKLASSRSEAERLMKQGGVELDGVRVDDVKREIELSKPGEYLVRAGKKKFLRFVVE